jgi:hypothetical protein
MQLVSHQRAFMLFCQHVAQVRSRNAFPPRRSHRAKEISMLARLAAALLACSYLTLAPHAFAADHEDHDDHGHHGPKVEFSLKSVASGDWSSAKTWEPARVPKAGDRVLISRHTAVRYDVASQDVIRLLQVVGTLEFARDRDTELNVAIVKVQNSTECSESGFACDFRGVNRFGEPGDLFPLDRPQLIIGTPEEPIPAEHTAKIRLHYLEGMSKDDAPAIVCCSARMDIHGSPLSRTWVKLGEDVKEGDTTVTLAEAVTGWRVGDEVIVTGSLHEGGGSFRKDYEQGKMQTEERKITKIDGNTLTLDAPLKNPHFGSGEFRSEVANLSRNVIIESADPKGVRGHTLYHRYSTGGVSYARLAHLGKEGVLGRYAMHFHLIGDTMRGSHCRFTQPLGDGARRSVSDRARLRRLSQRRARVLPRRRDRGVQLARSQSRRAGVSRPRLAEASAAVRPERRRRLLVDQRPQQPHAQRGVRER